MSKMLKIAKGLELPLDAVTQKLAFLELDPLPDGLALELHVYAREGGTLAVWLTESGDVLGVVVAGRA